SSGALEGLDGELMVRNARDFNSVQSAIMSVHGAPDFYYAVYDYIKSDRPFVERISDYKTRVLIADAPKVVYAVDQQVVLNPSQLADYYDVALIRGYEGVITKAVHGKYKQGRSTLNQQLC